MDPARLRVVELASIAILALFLAAMVRFGLEAVAPERQSRRAVLYDIALLALAAWVAEVSCIRLYAFYQYDAPWLLFLDVMPALVALIWPFVILSAREVVHALGLVDGKGAPHAWAVGVVVTFDAALVEPIAVRTGLWSWNEPGLWSVPLIGILGWGFFAAVASRTLDLPRGRSLVVVIAPLATHALLLAAWWGGLRWVLRQPLEGGTALLMGASASVLLAAVVLARQRRARLATMVPRIAAAALFFVLLAVEGGDDWALVLYGASFALPYVLATQWWGARGGAAAASR